ncbi:hypothetical protein FOQG_11998 [Fusarium oxysporum f. sp. raphani 54005]|uniref:Uncharacterized protein n=3 Tax=Fusarium oxysporum f. sp. raphani TaxID=96318 RepID=X0BNT3_FUSOX|nr:hypothetical protein FOQG_11998 [Fusarium oxysporum f. sp. raphani 54005]
MDPLSITTAVLACLQTSFSILSCCYSLRAEMRTIPHTMIEIMEEVRSLRNLMEILEPVLHGKEALDDKDSPQQAASQGLSNTIMPVIEKCLSELRALQERIHPERVKAILESKRKALLQTVTWRLKGSEAHDAIFNLQKCRASLNLVISSHNSVAICNIERLSLSIDTSVKESSQQLDELTKGFDLYKLAEQEEAVINWLSPTTAGQNHLQVKSTHHPGTSEWFHQSKEFQEWFSGNNKLLWLSGPSGSGKTMITSQAIESVASRISQGGNVAAHAFFYCDFRDPNTQSVANILGSLLGQLCTQTKFIPTPLLDAYRASTEKDGGCGPTMEMMNDIFKILSEKQKIYLLVDAADEAREYKQLANQLMSLARSTTNTNVLVTSRNEVAIQRVFTAVPRVCLEDHVSDVDKDIKRFIKIWYEPYHDLEWLSPEVQNLVSQSILSRSQGSFRWAACQLESLSHCRTVRDIRRTLSKLPEGLNETYGRLLLRTSASEVPLVRKILMWLSFSSVPLKLHELWEALAIEQGRYDIDDEFRLRSPQDILILTNSLVTVSSEGYVMLAHLSVRDYLLSDDIRQNSETAKFALELRTCHMEMAKDCLTYLFFSELASGPSTTEQEYLCRLEDLPLISYASRYWFYHALHAENSEEVHKLCLDFFLPESHGNFMAWVQVFNATSPFKWNVYPRHATSLYYASSLGLNRVVDTLVQSATVDELNAPGSRFGGTAIHAAAIRDHLTIIRQLVSAGADAGKADFNGVTPLHSAAGQGSEATIEVLLNCGSPKEARDGMEGKTPAEWARLSGYLSAADLIEEYSQSSYRKEESPVRKESRPGDSSKHDLVQLWRPRAGYFPDYYERRSGLDSSCIISISLGETTDILNSTAPLIQDRETKAQSLVW